MQIHDYKDITASIVNDQTCSYCTLMKDIQPLFHLQQLCTKLILIYAALSGGCCCLNACPSVQPCSQLRMEDWTVQLASLNIVLLQKCHEQRSLQDVVHISQAAWLFYAIYVRMMLIMRPLQLSTW